mmetsp:Transcript_114623/g.214615  ORF Transcript_114623/g.214615 Transcript_114623/m.214615 type:complete len:215 (-) Transcript_114623:2879-3523(-)
MCSVRAETIILVMLATMKILPPSSSRGAEASVAFSTTASRSSMCCVTSDSKIFATNFCSALLPAARAFASSTWMLLVRLKSFEISPKLFAAFLSRCLSVRNFLASSNLDCASLSASASLSQIACASSGEISSALCVWRGAAASTHFCTASSAALTLAVASCRSACRFRPSVSDLKAESLFVASSTLVLSVLTSSSAGLETPSMNFLISAVFDAR